MQRILRSDRFIPVLLAAITLLAYGLLLPSTGFHWDDWGFAWLARFRGPAEFIPAFSGFRPFLGPIFLITTSLIPPVPLYWQIFALIVRFAIGLAAWWALRSIWPSRPRIAFMLALFVLVFPGYSQHWAALTHINQELIPFIFYLLSFGISARAIRSKSPAPLVALALLFQFIGLFPTEYFFGLEPLRFLLIWSMLDDTKPFQRVQRAIQHWFPYLALWLVNGAWLFTLYSSDAYISYGLAGSADLSPAGLLTAFFDSVLKAGLYVWLQVLVLAGIALPSPTSLITLALAALCFALIAFYVLRFAPFSSPAPPDAPADHDFGWFLLLSGIVSIFLGRLPSLAAGLPLTLQSSFDRFMISLTLGGSLFLAGVIELAFKRRDRLKIIAACLAVALGVGQQFYNANLFRRDWARQQEIYWQMAWRVPSLRPGTVILTDKIPAMPFETDLSFTAAVNWLYAPEYNGGDLPYALLYTEARLGGGSLPELAPGSPVTLPFRTVSFRGSTDAALTVLFPENGCLRVLDPALGEAETYEKESPFLLQAIPFSDPSRIGDGPAPIPPFSAEPEHAWCYYYEKAELARHLQDWQTVADLGRAAQAAGYAPEDAVEWLPFIEGYAQTGDAALAAGLSREAFEAAPRVRKGLCQVWSRLAADGIASAPQMLGEFGCTP